MEEAQQKHECYTAIQHTLSEEHNKHPLPFVKTDLHQGVSPIEFLSLVFLVYMELYTGKKRSDNLSPNWDTEWIYV